MLFALESGKRVRPLLCLAAAAACGGGLDDAVPAAVALELMHGYSLVHDDLPALDDDDTRRGRPTVHVRYGEALALLVGDALLTAAFGALAAPPDRGGGLGGAVLAVAQTAGGASWAARRLAIARELAAGAGSLGMAGGQAAELIADPPAGADQRRWPSPQPDRGGAGSADGGGAGTEERLAVARYVAEHKTGALFRAACRAGGISAGAGPAEMAALTRIGATYGLAYQIHDDINDETRDRAQGRKLNHAVIIGSEAAAALFSQAKSAAESSARVLEWPGSPRWLVEIMSNLGNGRDGSH
jgi:geranylgeranyl diphosphate synthase type II